MHQRRVNDWLEISMVFIPTISGIKSPFETALSSNLAWSEKSLVFSCKNEENVLLGKKSPFC